MAKRSTLDVIREEQERRGFGQALDSFVLLRESGDEVTLRFLDELEGKDEDATRVARTFKVHEYGGMRTKGGGRFEALLCDGANCQYCADNNQARTHVVLRVWVYDDNAIKLFDVKARADVMVDLADDFEKEGNITGADYLYSRKGKELNTRYRLRRQEDARMKKKVRRQVTEQWLKGSRVRELVEARYKPWGGAEEKKGDDDD